MDTRAYIPAKQSIHSTSDIDGVNTSFGYWGPLSYPMRRRLDMAVQEMRRAGHYEMILDAGYGCGIMLPDLYRRLGPGGKLYGMDVHGEHQGVRSRMLPAEGMDPSRVFLEDASLDRLPYPDDSFDLVVSISVLEHIPPKTLPGCMSEIRRVARPGADIILGFPTYSPCIRLLSQLQGTNLRENHPSTEDDIFAAIRKAGFVIKSNTGFPKFWGPLTMHYNVRLEPVS
jgi:ubiquinone/menaquinone biosynthesis C-methylase UbiE